MMEPRACEECRGPADWGVADLQETELERNACAQLITLLVIRAIHWWCDAHRRVGRRYTRAGVRIDMR